MVQISTALQSAHQQTRIHRAKLFDAVMTPTIPYGLHTLPLTHFQLQQLDALQRRMLRSIVGWVRVGDEPWRMTMHRMKLRVNAVLALHILDPWTKRLTFRQHSFASHVVETCGWAMNVWEWHPEADWQYSFTVQPTRRPGRPLTRWDDRLRSFCKRHFPNAPCWTQVASCTEWKHKTPEFVSEFLTL